MIGLETFTYINIHRSNSGNKEESMGLERLKECLTEEWCTGQSNEATESEGENRI